MKLKTFILSLLIPLSLAVQPANAASEAVQQMAEVLLNMKTAPSAPQREALKPIANGSNVTAASQNLAKAILSMNGTVKAEDKSLVYGVLRDVGSSEDERELAMILNQFDGKADKGQKQRLTALLPPPPEPKKKEAKADKPADKKADAGKGEGDKAAQ